MPDFNQLPASAPARPRIVIASPALAAHNNGNWQTASRWASFLQGAYAVDIVPHWQAGDGAADLLIALHARRSAPALAAFTQACPGRPTVLVLTGTDLYRDIDVDAAARAALWQAGALVLLQAAGLDRLAPALHARTRVIYQSAPALLAAPGTRTLDCCMIGHLREEKDPQTFMRAAALVRHPDARLVHIGAALEPALGAAAQATSAAQRRYRWLGGMARDAARAQLARSHAMVIASRMEGGANVIIEALTSGVPVLASAIDGNRGMLGSNYAGYFALGDAAALAALIDRSYADPAFYALLQAQCAARAALFTPQAERAAVRELVDNLLHASAAPPSTEQETP